MRKQSDPKVQQVGIGDTPAILACLEEAGIVLVPGFLSMESVAAAVKECHALFEHTPDWGHHEEYSLGQSVRMERAEMDHTEFPVLSSVLAHPALEEVVEGFFGAGYIFSRTIYAILDVVGSETSVQQLHYDKMRHLKSFIYLTDVGLENGPFHCVPGSHLIARVAQRENRSRNIVPTDDDVRVLPPELTDRRLPVTGKAGTLILFDSDISHHAGIVTSGERLAIRSLSFGAYRKEVWYRPDGEIMPVP